MAEKSDGIANKGSSYEGSLLLDTAVTVASLILFPAIFQRLNISPVVMRAVQIALPKN